MKNKLLYCLLLVLLVLSFGASAAADEVRISAAASLTDAVKEIVAAYQQENPQTKLLANFASSGALAKQIAAGAPTDIYISANPKWLDQLQQQNLIDEPSKQVLVRNSLVFAGISTSARSLADLPDLQRVAICSPKTSPAGRYAEQALQAAGVYRDLQTQQKLILAKDVRQALLYAERGEVDGAFVYRTDALLAKQARVLFVVPQQLYPQVVYPAALTIAGERKDSAKAFYSYLFTDSAALIFTKYGFVIP